MFEAAISVKSMHMRKSWSKKKNRKKRENIEIKETLHKSPSKNRLLVEFIAAKASW